MKSNKVLILLAVFTMCVVGCNQKRGKTSSDFSSELSENPVDPIESIVPSEEPITPPESISSSKIEISESFPDSEPISSSEPDEPQFPEPGNSLTPTNWGIGFPRDAINYFLEENEIEDYVVPDIAVDQKWSYRSYTYFPVFKLWTPIISTSEVSYEDQYRSILTDAGEEVSTLYYDTVGYSIVDKYSTPKLVFKVVGDFFVIYINAPAYDPRQLDDGGYPYEALDEYFDLMNVKNVPPFPLLELDPGWKYYNCFFNTEKMWKLYTGYPDPNSPDHTEVAGPALEDLYKELLEADGWDIDSSQYNSYGYFATKEWVEIQFFSWYDTFRLFVYKKA